MCPMGEDYCPIIPTSCVDGGGPTSHTCVHLLHDNAPVHTAAISKSAVRDCGLQELDHPPYSPDLAPSDYYLFSKLKKDLRGRKFHSDEDLGVLYFLAPTCIDTIC